MIQKVDRLQALNNLWMLLTAPKKGDKIKFKITGQKKIYDGKINKNYQIGFFINRSNLE